LRTKIPLSEVLIENSTYARHALKKRLIEEKLLEYKCQSSSNEGTWNGYRLSLHLDHVNGIFNDNRLANLRFLCPNCHSQTDSYAGKNIIGKTNKGTAKTDYRYVKREKDRERWEKIKNGPIEFGKHGWVGQVAKELGIFPQKVNKWILRVDAEFYKKYYTDK